jgi:hypothetical protein
MYFGFLRHMQIGGGNAESLWPVVSRSVAYASGLPVDLDPAWVLGLTLVVLGAGVWMLMTKWNDAWIFYVIAIAASPLLLLILQPSDLHFERYYAVNVALLLLLGSRMIGFVATRAAAGAAAAYLLVAAFAVGNLPRIERLLDEQRGQYRAAIRYMVDHSPEGRIAVSSDHDFRNGVVLGYYARREAPNRDIVYVRSGSWQGAGPSWLLLHRFAGEAPPGTPIGDPSGNRYDLTQSFPSGPLSGWSWYVFRRSEAHSTR